MPYTLIFSEIRDGVAYMSWCFVLELPIYLVAETAAQARLSFAPPTFILSHV